MSILSPDELGILASFPGTVITDLDRCCVDNAARAALATLPDGSMDWPTLFDPQWIGMDDPMPTARAALQALHANGHMIWYVSAREDGCLEATVAWLHKHGYPQADHVICRARYRRSAEFKAGTVLTLSRDYPPAILFVDDNAANRAAVQALEIAGLVVQEGW